MHVGDVFVVQKRPHVAGAGLAAAGAVHLQRRLVALDNPLGGDLLEDAGVDGLGQLGGPVVQAAQLTLVDGDAEPQELVGLSMQRRGIEGARHHDLCHQTRAVLSLVDDLGGRRGRDDMLPAATGEGLLHMLLTLEPRRDVLVDGRGTAVADLPIGLAATGGAGARRRRYRMLDRPCLQGLPRLVVVASFLLRRGAVALRGLALSQLLALRRHALALLAEDAPLHRNDPRLEVLDLDGQRLGAVAPATAVLIVRCVHDRRLIIFGVCCRSQKRRDHQILHETSATGGRQRGAGRTAFRSMPSSSITSCGPSSSMHVAPGPSAGSRKQPRSRRLQYSTKPPRSQNRIRAWSRRRERKTNR